MNLLVMPVIPALLLLSWDHGGTPGPSGLRAPSGQSLPGGQRPNLLLIIADDMGYGDLGCYGSLQIKTPHLDALAAAGTRCTDGYVSSSVCAPSRAGILTGRNGARFGFEHNLSVPDHLRPEFAGVPLDEPLLPERLGALGYRTGLVGKWHLGASLPEQHPMERGFDSFFGMLGGSHGYWPVEGQHRLLRGKDPAGAPLEPYLTDWFTAEALNFIDAESKDARRAEGDGTQPPENAPWFLMLSYNSPHGPMQARADDLEIYEHIHDNTRRAYCAMQHRMDQGIGRIVARLAEMDALENTLIVFLSDNGGSVEVSHAVNAPLRGTKGTFLEGGIRVPLLVHWPAQVPAGVYRPPVSALDVCATFVSAAGGTMASPDAQPNRGDRSPSARARYDSVDLIPFLNHEREDAPHPSLRWRMALRGSAIREGDWKLLRPNSEPAALYNLRDDVGEQTDRSNDHPEIADRLLDSLNRWEGTLERNPMFISAPRWSAYNRRLYERDFCLTQPTPEDSRDIWSFDYTANSAR